MTVDLDTRRPTLSAAARVTGVIRRLIRRHLEGGRSPGAERAARGAGEATGRWRIPLAELRAAGLLGIEPPAPASAPASVGSGPSPNVALDLIRLRADLAAAVRRAEVAEATVLECERLIEAQRLALAERSAGSSHPSRTPGHDGRSPTNGHVPSTPYVPPRNEPAADPPCPRPEEAGADGSEADRGPTSDRGDGMRSEPAPPTPPPVGDRTELSPPFAASWASAPPWEHSPAATPPPARRWWQRVR